MGRMVNGEWLVDDFPTSKSGRFEREPTTFRDVIEADSRALFAAQADRYHLYASWACPWAHRALIVRRLKGLESVISLSVVDHYMTEHGWHFSDNPGAIPDSVNRAEYLREIYLKARSDYTGRITVPVLWDKEKKTIVNNESREIIKMLDSAFDALGKSDLHFYPPKLRPDIDAVLDQIYGPINNGVYRCGFAKSQGAYDEAVDQLFEALEHWDKHLGSSRYLCGAQLSIADWCLFTTLVRFDLVYHTHFKCNIKRIVDFPNLWNYLKELYQVPGVAQTCNFDHIKKHYYQSHDAVNPSRIVARGPEIPFEEAHDRERL